MVMGITGIMLEGCRIQIDSLFVRMMMKELLRKRNNWSRMMLVMQMWLELFIFQGLFKALNEGYSRSK
jgi:hypothetical protein